MRTPRSRMSAAMSAICFAVFACRSVPLTGNTHGSCPRARICGRGRPGGVPQGADLWQERPGELDAADQHGEALGIAAKALDELAFGSADPEAVEEVKDRNVHD